MSAVGCRDAAKVEQVHKEGGLDWGGGGGGGTDSTWDDPVAMYLGETVQPGMKHPNRIAVGPDGRVAVSDPRAGKVFLFAATGEVLRSINVPRPMGIAIDDVGNLYVGDFGGGGVHVFDENGAYLWALGSGPGEFQTPTEIAWSSEFQRVHVVDTGAAEVKVYEAGGAFAYSYGAPGTGAGEFKMPTGIVLSDALDLVYVGDHVGARIEVFHRDGTWVKEFGSYGADVTEFSRIQGLALDKDNRLYVVDTFQGQLQVVDDAGLHISYLGSYGPGKDKLYQPMDVAFDSVFGRLLVTSYGNGRVLEYGIDDFIVPGTIPPLMADAWLEPGAVSDGGTKWLKLYVEVPDGSAADIVPDSMRLNGVAPDLSKGNLLGDKDGDGVPDLSAHFDKDAILATLPGPGDHMLAVEAELNTGDPTAADSVVGEVALRYEGVAGQPAASGWFREPAPGLQKLKVERGGGQ